MADHQKGCHAMAQGTSLLDMLNFDEHCANVHEGKPSKLQFLV